MGNLIAWVGIGLSPLGLGYFLPIVLPVGAMLVVLGVILMLLQK